MREFEGGLPSGTKSRYITAREKGKKIQMRFAKAATAILIAGGFLAGCTSDTSQSQAVLSGLGINRTDVPPLEVRPDRHRSWVSPDAANAAQLLFESDLGTDDVYIFALPDMTLKGTLTGFKEPLGECSDNHGNVWIANSLKNEMLEYSRSGALLNKIARPNLNPWACAVNPVNGDLAITQENRPHFQPGQVFVYSNPSSVPMILRNPVQVFYFYAAYDPRGDLWIDGTDALGHSMLSKCDAASCTTIGLSGGSIIAAGTIAWDKDNGTWVVFDQYCRDAPSFCSYPVSARGVVGTPTTYLSYTGGGLCDLIQVAMVSTGKRPIVVGGDNEYPCGSYKTGSVNRWAYPAGGNPMNSNVGSVFYPWGAAVSAK
jgi:hypothetical protein